MSSLFPLATFDLISLECAGRALDEWGHWLGPCIRPFGLQAFGLEVLGLGLIAVAVSASTVNARCGGYDRKEVVELARLCADPEHRWATRVCLRLWREIAPKAWGNQYWPVRAVVSYANALRHSGQIYRFDGWKKVAEVRGGVAGGNRSGRKKYDPKSVWAYEL